MNDPSVVVRKARLIGTSTVVGIPSEWADAVIGEHGYVRLRLTGRKIEVEPLDVEKRGEG